MNNEECKTEYVIFTINTDEEQEFIYEIDSSRTYRSSEIKNAIRFKNLNHAINVAEYVTSRDNRKVYVGKIETTFTIVKDDTSLN